MSVTIEPLNKNYGTISSPPDITVDISETEGYTFSGNAKIYNSSNELVKSEEFTGGPKKKYSVPISDVWDELNEGAGHATVEVVSNKPAPKTQINTVPSQRGTLTYNGTNLSPQFNDYDEAKLKISGLQSTSNAGTYTVNFTPRDGYCWSDGKVYAKTVQWVISKAENPLTMTPSTVTFTSSNSIEKVVFSNYFGQLSFSTNASSYISYSLSGSTLTIQPTGVRTDSSISINVTASGDSNHKSITKSIVVVFNIPKVLAVPYTTSVLYANGSYQSPVWQGYDSSKMTIGGTTKALYAGSYLAKFTPKAGYTWSDNYTGEKTVSWLIRSSEPELPILTATPTALEINYPTYDGDIFEIRNTSSYTIDVKLEGSELFVDMSENLYNRGSSISFRLTEFQHKSIIVYYYDVDWVTNYLQKSKTQSISIYYKDPSETNWHYVDKISVTCYKSGMVSRW